MTKDLTKGKTFNLILNFALPVLLGYLFQQFYNLVDTIIVGKGIGVGALAAVGSTGSVNFLIIGFCVGISTGVSIPVAQCFGAGDYSKMRQYIYNSVILMASVAVVFTIITVIFCKQLLIIMLTPYDIIDQASKYISIIFMGIPFILLFNLVASILRAVGDNKTPLVFLVVASIINIFLDLLLILVFQWGVAGAAIATIVSQGISGIACLVYMLKKFPILIPEHRDRQLDKSLLLNLTNSGLPMGLQYSVTAIGSVLLQVSINTLGSEIVAAVTAASKINIFFCAPFDALGTTMATFAGQNVGAKKWKRLKKGLRESLQIGFVYSIGAFVFMILFGKHLGTLFVDSSQITILNEIYIFLIFQSAFFCLLAIVNIVRFMIQGMGFGTFSIFSGVFEMIARAVMGLYIVPIFGFSAVCIASPMAWLLADLFLIPAFYFCLRRLLSSHKKARLKLQLLYSGNV
ncbi:MATE family efflux transporter [Spirochaeta cellobiosiphila]|uniref:MATE family efflux transporter n=1 Tax=Spirochaeta cellobiosiphila TaxID=504483 RepID=UPI0003FF92EC|nr:MATE family efflux transporter [Spirochaeta cellobiosiphila]